MGEYYVYVYADPGKKVNKSYGPYRFEYEPFYVGMGTGTRMYDHLEEAKSKSNQHHKHNRIRYIWKCHKREPEILKYKDGLTKEEALALEESLIGNIGRKDLKVGPLTNLKGGDSVKKKTEEEVVKARLTGPVLFYIDDIPYSSYEVAASVHGCTGNTVRNRVKSDKSKWDGWLLAADRASKPQNPKVRGYITQEIPKGGRMKLSEIVKHIEDLVTDGVKSKKAIFNNTIRMGRGHENPAVLQEIMTLVEARMYSEHGPWEE